MNVLIAPAALIYADPSLTFHICPETEMDFPLNFETAEDVSHQIRMEF
jgi:hypothetical protein